VLQGPYWLNVSGLDHPAYVHSARQSGQDLLHSPFSPSNAAMELTIAADAASLAVALRRDAPHEGAPVYAVLFPCDLTPPLQRHRIFTGFLDPDRTHSFAAVPPGCYRAAAVAGLSFSRLTDPQVLHSLASSSLRVELAPRAVVSHTLPLTLMPPQ
jgi:hypothetical protein